MTKQGQAGTKQGQAGTKQGQQGQNRDIRDNKGQNRDKLGQNRDSMAKLGKAVNTGTSRDKTGIFIGKARKTKVLDHS